MKLSNFNLNVITLFLLMATITAPAMPQAKNAAGDAADMKELYNHTLTMDEIHKLANVQKDLQALQKSNPEIAKDLDAGNSDGNLDQLTAKIQKYPPVNAVLKKDGLSPREYIVGTLTLIQAGMAVGMKKSGTYKEYPPKMLEVVSRANLTFLEQNWEAVTKIMPEFSSSGGDTNDKNL